MTNESSNRTAAAPRGVIARINGASIAKPQRQRLAITLVVISGLASRAFWETVLLLNIIKLSLSNLLICEQSLIASETEHYHLFLLPPFDQGIRGVRSLNCGQCRRNL